MSGNSSNKQAVVAFLAAAMLVLALLVFFRSRPINREKMASRMHQAGGAVMARLAEKAAGGTGRALLIVPDETRFDARQAIWIADQARAFESGLSSITIEGRETLAAIISRVNVASNRPTAFTPAVYRDFVKRHPGATIVVSFIGAPAARAEDAFSRDEKLPPMVCFSTTGAQVPELMAQGVIAAAVVPRSGPTPYKEGIHGDWFDVMYEVVTPETVGAWAGAARHR